MINSAAIIKLFAEIKAHKFNVILLRNISAELPFRLKEGKDIDVLVKPDSNFENYLLKHDFVEVLHPLRDNVFLYGVKPFKFFLNKNENILLDLHFGLSCRSLNEGEWIPLDQFIQDSAWVNCKMINDGTMVYTALEENDEMVALVTRCIFDKRHFPEGYKHRIKQLINSCNMARLAERFELIFFKYTPNLLAHLKVQDLDSIYSDYISFREY
jgi:hypothetical protein